MADRKPMGIKETAEVSYNTIKNTREIKPPIPAEAFPSHYHSIHVTLTIEAYAMLSFYHDKIQFLPLADAT